MPFTNTDDQWHQSYQFLCLLRFLHSWHKNDCIDGDLEIDYEWRRQEVIWNDSAAYTQHRTATLLLQSTIILIFVCVCVSCVIYRQYYVHATFTYVRQLQLQQYNTTSRAHALTTYVNNTSFVLSSTTYSAISNITKPTQNLGFKTFSDKEILNM